MLIMPEVEMLASVNQHKNERLSFPTRGASFAWGPSTIVAKRAVTPGPARQEYHAPPRSLFNRRRQCKTWVLDVDFPKTTCTSSTSSDTDDSALSTCSEMSQLTRENEPILEDSQDMGSASEDNTDTEDESTVDAIQETWTFDECLLRPGLLATAAMTKNWTFDECLRRPGLSRYLKITRHVRFGDKKTSIAASRMIKPYDREKDSSLPWVTVHDVEAAEGVRRALCAEITSRPTVDDPPTDSATTLSDEDATRPNDDAPATTAEGLLAGLPRLSRRSTMFGMATVAIGLVAWGASRRR